MDDSTTFDDSQTATPDELAEAAARARELLSNAYSQSGQSDDFEQQLQPEQNIQQVQQSEPPSDIVPQLTLVPAAPAVEYNKPLILEHGGKVSEYDLRLPFALRPTTVGYLGYGAFRMPSNPTLGAGLIGIGAAISTVQDGSYLLQAEGGMQQFKYGLATSADLGLTGSMIMKVAGKGGRLGTGIAIGCFLARMAADVIPDRLYDKPGAEPN